MALNRTTGTTGTRTPLNLADRSATLLQLYGLSGADGHALAAVLEGLPKESIEEEQILCLEGDPPEQMWFLLDGAVQVRKRSYAGDALALATVHAPAILGHMGMVDGAPRSATCVVAEGGTVALLDREQFRSVLVQVGPGGDAFRRLLIASMNRQLDLGNAELRRLTGSQRSDRLEGDLAATEATFSGWNR